MTSPSRLNQAWRDSGRLRPVHRRAVLTDRGLVLGAETMLAAMTPDYFGRPRLDLDGHEARLLALLAAASGRPADPWVIEGLRPVARAWRTGDPALARFHLAYAGLPQLDRSETAPRRLFIAAGLLDAGWSPFAALAAAADAAV